MQEELVRPTKIQNRHLLSPVILQTGTPMVVHFMIAKENTPTQHLGLD